MNDYVEVSYTCNARKHSVRGMPAVSATDGHDRREHATTNRNTCAVGNPDRRAYTHVYANSNLDADPGPDAYSNPSWDRDSIPDTRTASNSDPCTCIDTYARADTALVK